MLVRFGLASCILACIVTLAFALTALEGIGGHALGLAALYTFAGLSVLVFLGGEAAAAVRRSRADGDRPYWMSWLAPALADDAGQPQTPHRVDDLVGMLGDTLKLAGNTPSVEFFEPIDVAELVGNLGKQPGFAHLRIAPRATSCHALASHPAIARTLQILVENAIANGSQASVSCDRGTSTVVVRVDDNGPGVARSERGRVFDWQYYMSTPRWQQIGCRADLVIARQIARAHGGDIVVGPSPLGGACFSLRLPALDEYEFEMELAS